MKRLVVLCNLVFVLVAFSMVSTVSTQQSQPAKPASAPTTKAAAKPVVKVSEKLVSDNPNNQELIDLAQGGASERNILGAVAVAKSAGQTYDISGKAVVVLLKAGIGDNVIEAIRGVSVPTTTPQPSTKATSENVARPAETTKDEKAGIFTRIRNKVPGVRDKNSSTETSTTKNTKEDDSKNSTSPKGNEGSSWKMIVKAVAVDGIVEDGLQENVKNIEDKAKGSKLAISDESNANILITILKREKSQGLPTDAKKAMVSSFLRNNDGTATIYDLFVSISVKRGGKWVLAAKLDSNSCCVSYKQAATKIVEKVETWAKTNLPQGS